jgi:hypothetical protein
MSSRLTKLVGEQSVLPLLDEINAARSNRRIKYGEEKTINGFDIDGVITAGLYPGPDDVIITGRSYCMAEETLRMLHEKGIYNAVYFNPEHRSSSSRESSGYWKSLVINQLATIQKFFEDDPIQAAVIEQHTSVEVVFVISEQEK